MSLVVGEEILKALRLAGWTQTRLAKETGLTLKHINQVVKGHVDLTPRVAVAIERSGLGTSAIFLSVLEAREQVRQERAKG